MGHRRPSRRRASSMVLPAPLSASASPTSVVVIRRGRLSVFAVLGLTMSRTPPQPAPPRRRLARGEPGRRRAVHGRRIPYPLTRAHDGPRVPGCPSAQHHRPCAQYRVERAPPSLLNAEHARDFGPPRRVRRRLRHVACLVTRAGLGAARMGFRQTVATPSRELPSPPPPRAPLTPAGAGSAVSSRLWPRRCVRSRARSLSELTARAPTCRWRTSLRRTRTAAAEHLRERSPRARGLRHSGDAGRGRSVPPGGRGRGPPATGRSDHPHRHPSRSPSPPPSPRRVPTRPPTPFAHRRPPLPRRCHAPRRPVLPHRGAHHLAPNVAGRCDGSLRHHPQR